jgi:hypothetical protein
MNVDPSDARLIFQDHFLFNADRRIRVGFGDSEVKDESKQKGGKTACDRAREMLNLDGKCGYDIIPVENDKKKIYVRPTMESGIIPRHPCSVIFNGKSGSGKSTVLLNLLLRGDMYGPSEDDNLPDGYFDEIFIFAPTAKSDDVWQKITEVLNIPDNHLITSPSPSVLQKLLGTQRRLIEHTHKGKVHEAPRILFILDDVVSHQKFLKSKPVLQAFVANRHYGASTWICSQSFTKVPRACRLQASGLVFFKGTESELRIVTEEFQPPGGNDKEFRGLVTAVTDEPHSFLFVNLQRPFDERYRKNFTHILKLRVEDTCCPTTSKDPYPMNSNRNY